MTLADDDWITAAPGTPTRWQLTHHILTVAYMRPDDGELQQRARDALVALRDETGESALLSVPDVRNFIVMDVIESRQMLRTSTSIGTIVPAQGSATGQVLLPYLSPERQRQMLGAQPDASMREQFQAARQHGYAVSTNVVIDGVVIDGATNIAAPIFEVDGRPIGAIAITGPTARMTADHQARIGPLVAHAARTLSRGTLAAF